MARNHTDITQLEEVDMREVAQKPCLNLEGIIEESCLEPINSDDYWLFKCRIEDYRNRRCPLCKGTAVHSHGDYGKPRLIHDINVGKKRVDILLKVKRYLCDSCEKTFTNIPECILENRQMTDRLFELIQRESFRHPFTDVAEEYGYSITTIATIFDDYGAKLEAKRGPVVAPRVLGIDEKHIVNNMRAVFVDGESGCLLEMCEDNKRDTILHTIENMVDYDTNIEIVTMDMACGYRSYIQECLPRATIVVDKFHVYQDFLTKVGTVKTKITERIKSRINAMPEGPEKEHLNAIMKMAQANNYLFKYGEEKIAEDSSRLSKMANICEAFPEFNHLRLIRTGFERIYASADRASAEAVCDKWAKLIPPAGQKQITAWEEHFHVDAELFAELRPFRNTITRNWRNEIFNYFNVNCQFTNAVAEGLNCFIERINRQGNGYGFKRLRIKALFWDTAGERVKYVVKENRLWKSSKPVHSFFTGSGSSFSFNNGHYETTYSIEPEEIPRSRTAPFSVLEYYQLLKDAGFNIL